MFKEYRIKSNYTQEQIAEIMGLSTRQIQRIENGISTPKISTLAKLSKLLKIKDEDIGKYVKNIKTK